MSENGNGFQVETAVDESEELPINVIATSSDEGADGEDEDQPDGAFEKCFKKCDHFLFSCPFFML